MIRFFFLVQSREQPVPEFGFETSRKTNIHCCQLRQMASS